LIESIGVHLFEHSRPFQYGAGVENFVGLSIGSALAILGSQLFLNFLIVR
jgi:hypothetical protein